MPVILVNSRLLNPKMISFSGLPADLKSQRNLIFFPRIENWSVKNKNPQKSVNFFFEGHIFSITSFGYGSLLALNISLTSILL